VTRDNNNLLCISDDAILAFQKQAQIDITILNTAREVEGAILKELSGLKVKVDRLLQMRQCEL
jgi:hypothetical protein